MLRVGDRITNHVLEENFQDAASLFIDETRDTLDTAATGKSTNGLGNGIEEDGSETRAGILLVW
jgi:hypothetical protein